jgi:hypothetical protein
MRNLTNFGTILFLVPFLVPLGCGGSSGGADSDSGTGLDGQTLLDVGAPNLDVATTPDLATPDTATGVATDVVAADTRGVATDTGASLSDVNAADTRTSDIAPAPDAATANWDTAVNNEADARAADAANDALVVDTAPVQADTAAPDMAKADASTVVPVLSALSPATGNVGQAITLSIAGTGFEVGAIAYYDGQALATTVGSGNSITAQVTSTLTTQPGSHAVSVSNGTGRTSNTLYLVLTIPAGAPEILDYTPDNGVATDTITIVGHNLASETISITGPNGLHVAAMVTDSSTWLGQPVDTVTFTLPNNWQTGAMIVTNSKGSSRGKIFNVGANLARLAGVTAQASSEYSSSWVKERGVDNDLSTSWFSKNGDCATSTSCTTVPWISVTFPSVQSVSRIAIRGNREYASGYDFLRARIDVVGSAGALWTGSYDLPNPDRDLDIILPAPVPGVTSVKFTSLADESSEPGLSEIEVF